MLVCHRLLIFNHTPLRCFGNSDISCERNADMQFEAKHLILSNYLWDANGGSPARQNFVFALTRRQQKPLPTYSGNLIHHN